MMHKAWCNLEEVPYNFLRSSIKSKGHTGWKIDELNLFWVRLLGRSQLSNPSDLPCLSAKTQITHFLLSSQRMVWGWGWEGGGWGRQMLLSVALGVGVGWGGGGVGVRWGWEGCAYATKRCLETYYNGTKLCYCICINHTNNNSLTSTKVTSMFVLPPLVSHLVKRRTFLWLVL